MKARLGGATAVLGVLIGILAVSVGGVASAASKRDAAAVAPGGPGSLSYFDLARKDCVGTARNTSSRVWFTVADGVLSDTYWPNVDATNVHTLQYLVTDGSTFTDLQTRDMTYKVVPDPTGMSCTVVATPDKANAAHGYRITTTYIADAARNAVLMRTKFEGPRADRLYVRLDPLAGGTGGGGSQNAGGNTAVIAPGNVPVDYNINTTTNAVNRDYAVPTYMALESSNGFGATSVGYADSSSDGLTTLDSSHSLIPYASAPNGHVTLTAAVPLPRDRTVNLALGFGQTQQAATNAAGASASQSFDSAWAEYERQWLRYDAGLRRPSFRLGLAAVREYYESVNVVKASEDKQFPGAIAAGLASPWGQAVPAGNTTNGEPTYFGSYREVFARDLYEAFAGLLVAGDIRTARDATLFLFDRQQQPDGSMPRNSLENGKVAPDTGGLQLDETSYPILMAWQSGLAGDSSLYNQHVIPAADFLVAHGPSDGVERWEEQSGYSPSTIAAEIAGLTAAANIARVNHDRARARIYQATADYFARNVEKWTVATVSPFHAPPYFLRLSKTGDPNAAITYTLNNGNNTPFDQRQVIDAGFLELVRLGVLPASDPDVQNSLKVVDATIERTTPSGPGFYRYGTNASQSEDGYGDCYVLPSGTNATGCFPSGKPWPSANPGTTNSNVGTGHLWPVLSGERGEYEVAAGDFHFGDQLLTSMRNMTSGQGLEPEQAWEDPDLAASPFESDPTTASIGFADGQPAGSASPADVGPVAVRAARARAQHGPQPRDPGHRHRPLRPARDAGLTAVDGHLAGERRQRHQLHGDRDGDDGRPRWGRRRGRRRDRRNRRDRLDRGRQVRQLVAVAAGRVPRHDDHGHRDVGTSYRLRPAVGRRGTGNHRAERRRSDRRRRRSRDLRVPDQLGVRAGRIRPHQPPGQRGRDERLPPGQDPRSRQHVRQRLRRPASRRLRPQPIGVRGRHIDRRRVSR